MNNNSNTPEYTFPDYDPDQQLIAVSKVITQLVSCLDKEEKAFKSFDYSKLDHEYSGDLYANDCCELFFLDVAVSHSAVAVFAPFLEGLFKHEITALQTNGYTGAPEHIRTNKSKFWDINYSYDSNGKEIKGKAKGFLQILDALRILRHFPEKSDKMLEIIFAYRNYAIHGGFEAKMHERVKFNTMLKANKWSNNFSWATTDGKPHMISMKKEFINKCFTFCRLVKEGFEKEKGLCEL